MENFTFYTSVAYLIKMQFPHLTLHLSSINLVNFCLKTCYFPSLKDYVSQADNLSAQAIHTLLMYFSYLFSYTNVCKYHNLQLKELRSVPAQRWQKKPVHRKQWIIMHAKNYNKSMHSKHTDCYKLIEKTWMQKNLVQRTLYWGHDKKSMDAGDEDTYGSSTVTYCSSYL